MTNEEKILSMLDLIASEIKDLKDISVTKDEFRSFKEQSNDRFNKMEQTLASMDSKLESVDEKINEQIDMLEARFDVLNERLFKQETQVRILRKKTP